MEKNKTSKWLKGIGAVLILAGIGSLPLDNGTWLHDMLQIGFVVGCILYLSDSKPKKSKLFLGLGMLLVVFFIASNINAQDYKPQIRAFENSFHQKSLTSVQPFLSDSLRFAPLPPKNTLPILTNIVTKLPKLNSLEIIASEKGKTKLRYDFEQLGVSESNIHLDADGKIWKIDFVDNLVKQQLEQQKKMQSSVKVPDPGKVTLSYNKETVTFKANDGLMVTGNLYHIGSEKPVILLCHQAGYNKFEYADIAPRLNKMGYNAMALDQRSGGSFAGKMNETHELAKNENKTKVGFTDALQDIEAAIDYLSKKYGQKIILWGSSYSAGLVLHIASHNNKVKGVIAFSPGDYFGDKLPSLRTVFPKIKQPFLVTSSKEESTDLKELLEKSQTNDDQMQFIPESEGFHGSRAVWIGQKGADEYWNALSNFLGKLNEI